MNNNENKFDNMGYGEKKCLLALYTVAKDYLDNIYFVKQDDLWHAYYKDEDTEKLICSSVLVFDVCSSILKRLEDEDLYNRFINNLRNYVSSKQTDEFINESSTIKLH